MRETGLVGGAVYRYHWAMAFTGSENRRVVNVMLGREQGGIEQAVMDYADALTCSFYEVHTIIDPRAAIIPALEAEGTPFTCLSNRGAWDVWAVATLRRRLADIKPYACIAHGNRAVSLLKRAAGRRFPVVGVMHNYKIRGAGLAHVVCPTLHLRAHIRERGMEEERISIVPNLVRVGPEKPRVPHTPLIIGAMGRMVAKKGFSVLVEALAQLAARNMAFHAILAGDGPERGALEALVASRGLQGRVTFPGWATDKQAFFDGIDVFCLPSLHEPFGIVLLEAMAQALPVVAAASEGPSEIITDNGDGLLAPPGDASRLADALWEFSSPRPPPAARQRRVWNRARAL